MYIREMISSHPSQLIISLYKLICVCEIVATVATVATIANRVTACLPVAFQLWWRQIIGGAMKCI